MSVAAVSRAVRPGTLQDIARLTAVLAAGLAAGAALATWLADMALGGSAMLYIEYRQATTGLFTATLPPLGGLALVAAAVCAVLGRGPSRARGRALALAAVICLVAAMAVTVVVHFPINAEILTWTPAAPPADWEQVHDSWATAHSARTLLSLAGFVLLALDMWRGHDSPPR